MNLLRQYRKANGLTQQRLARKLHITQYDICLIERNVRLPWPSEAQAIAEYFGVKASVIFPDGTKEKYEPPAGYVDPRIYIPPAPEPPPAIAYPREFRVRCWRCGAWISLESGSERPLMHEDLACFSCARPFDIAIPQGVLSKSQHAGQKSEGAGA